MKRPPVWLGVSAAVLASLFGALMALLLVGVFPGALEPFTSRRADFQRGLVSRQATLLEPLSTPAKDDPSGAAVTPALRCKLTWVSGPATVQPSGCDGAPAVSPQLVTRVVRLKDDVLRSRASLEVGQVDLAWMKSVAGQDDWSAFTLGAEPLFETPVPDWDSLRALVMVRLAAGLDAGDVGPALSEVEGLLRAVVGLPLRVSTASAQRVASQAVAALKVAGAEADTARLEALGDPRRFARRELAAGVWHPWVDSSFRTKVLPELSPFERCMAALEGAALLEFGALLDQRYPGHRADFEAWARGPKGCSMPFVEVALEKSRTAAWKERLRRDGFVPDDNWLWSFFVWSSSAYRATELEKLLERSKPFDRPNTAS
ncbi:MAG: hypothetical protein SFW67_34155 [Myxococcaceae bacterium]|nr:hypothetical protein [Myxococcaceae bacterium]